MFCLHDVRNATLARLAVNANHRLVVAANMLWVEWQIGNTPLVVVIGKRLKAFFDCILVAARKCGVHQVANVWLAFGNRQTIAIFGIATQCIDVGDIEFGINTIDEQVHCQRNQVDIARALTVAEQRSFNTISASHHTKLGCSNCATTVVMWVQ